MPTTTDLLPSQTLRASSSPNSQHHSQHPVDPALVTVTLSPLFPGHSFQAKSLTNLHLQPVSIGRQTSSKTIPTSANGYFDNKVLSRSHALIFAEQDGKVYVKDTKSSNGTFINGNRLSDENQESDAYPLSNGDVIDFGVDILGENGVDILYQKVSCRVQIDAPTSSASANAFASQEDALQKKFQEILNEKQNLADEVNRMKTEIAEARVSKDQLSATERSIAELKSKIATLEMSTQKQSRKQQSGGGALQTMILTAILVALIGYWLTLPQNEELLKQLMAQSEEYRQKLSALIADVQAFVLDKFGDKK